MTTTSRFPLGSTVSFTHKGRIITGLVRRNNAKTTTVETPQGKWRVSPSLLVASTKTVEIPVSPRQQAVDDIRSSLSAGMTIEFTDGQGTTHRAQVKRLNAKTVTADSAIETYRVPYHMVRIAQEQVTAAPIPDWLQVVGARRAEGYGMEGARWSRKIKGTGAVICDHGDGGQIWLSGNRSAANEFGEKALAAVREIVGKDREIFEPLGAVMAWLDDGQPQGVEFAAYIREWYAD